MLVHKPPQPLSINLWCSKILPGKVFVPLPVFPTGNADSRSAVVILNESKRKTMLLIWFHSLSTIYIRRNNTNEWQRKSAHDWMSIDTLWVCCFVWWDDIHCVRQRKSFKKNIIPSLLCDFKTSLLPFFFCFIRYPIALTTFKYSSHNGVFHFVGARDQARKWIFIEAAD